MFGQRKILLINKRVQMKILAFAMFFSVLSSLMTLLILSIARRQAEVGDAIGTTDLLIVGSLSMVLLTLIILMGFYLTNQICGPIYRLQMELRKILKDEEARPIHLRDGDEFIELIAEFNSLIEKVNLRK